MTLQQENEQTTSLFEGSTERQHTVLDTFIAELFSFNGIGPELHAVIQEIDQLIAREESGAEKEKHLERRNKILKEILLDGLQDLYGEEGIVLYEQLVARLEAIPIQERMPVQEKFRDNCFIVYPDTFGRLKELISILPTLKQLGVSKMHLLPFFDHAGDAGYAVRYHSLEEPLRIHPDWSREAFDALVQAADEQGISLVVDVILNHMAIDSPMLESEEAVTDLLLSWPVGEQPFKLMRTEEDIESGGTYAVYQLQNGHEVRVLIMFPEQAGDDPLLVAHYDRDVYHTFYPFQADLDFNNTQAFSLVAHIVMQAVELTGRRGQLRLDAIPFIGKQIGPDFFQNMDSEAGYKIITLIRIIVALFAPNVTLVAEASRPLSEIEKYLNRVGAAYDFISLPYYLLAVASDDPELFLQKVTQVIDEIGTDGIAKLVFALQTHDDYPLAELKDPVADDVWKIVQRKNAHAFGRAEGKETIPKGAAVRLAELCDSDPGKLAAAVALAAFTPHGDLFFLFGTEIGLENDEAALAREKEMAEEQERKVDKREVIRSKLDVDTYLEAVVASESFPRISQLLHARREHLPELITHWQYSVSNEKLVTIEIEGKKHDQPVRLLFVLNYSPDDQADHVVSGEILMASSPSEEVEPWGFRLYQLS